MELSRHIVAHIFAHIKLTSFHESTLFYKNKRKRAYLELKLKATKNTTFLKPKKLQKEVSTSSCLQKTTFIGQKLVFTTTFLKVSTNYRKKLHLSKRS